MNVDISFVYNDRHDTFPFGCVWALRESENETPYTFSMAIKTRTKNTFAILGILLLFCFFFCLAPDLYSQFETRFAASLESKLINKANKMKLHRLRRLFGLPRLTRGLVFFLNYSLVFIECFEFCFVYIKCHPNYYHTIRSFGFLLSQFKFWKFAKWFNASL